MFAYAVRPGGWRVGEGLASCWAGAEVRHVEHPSGQTRRAREAAGRLGVLVSSGKAADVNATNAVWGGRREMGVDDGSSHWAAAMRARIR